MTTKAAKTPSKRGGARKGAGRKAGVVGKLKKELADMAREHAPDALQALIDVCKDATAPPAARVSAANSIIDRGYGRPHQAVKLSGNVTVKTLSDFYAERAAEESDADEGGDESE